LDRVFNTTSNTVKISVKHTRFSRGFWTPLVFVIYAVKMKVGIYARVSTQEQQTLPLQIKDLREYAERRKWKIEVEITDVASGAKTRPKREELLKLARQRKLDCILVWRLDRFGRSLADLIIRTCVID
jgi:predicted site-specific integrase-resolvase